MAEVSSFRQHELSLRSAFFKTNGRFIPRNWPLFHILDDYPHNAFKQFEPCDLNLPHLDPADVRRILADTRAFLEHPSLLRLYAYMRIDVSAVEAEPQTIDVPLLAGGKTHTEQLAEMHEEILALHLECDSLVVRVCLSYADIRFFI